jgi:hypothetical protein
MGGGLLGGLLHGISQLDVTSNMDGPDRLNELLFAIETCTLLH